MQKEGVSLDQLAIIFDTLLSAGHKPAKVRQLLGKAVKKTRKHATDFDGLCQLFRLKPDSGIVKPKNAWQLFLAEYRLNNKGQKLAGSEQTMRASKLWAELEDKDKEPYNIEASKQSELYKEQKLAIDGPKPNRSRGRPRKTDPINLNLEHLQDLEHDNDSDTDSDVDN
jgi:hypothetical protein